MVSVRRWAVVASGVAVLVALPATLAALPYGRAASPPVTCSPGSGFVAHVYSATPNRSVPVAAGDPQFGTVADLFGQTTQLRAWYRGPTDFRVDTITLAGESDIHAGATGTWTWDYEDNQATWTGGAIAPAVRLPASGDLLPTNSVGGC